MITGSLFLNYYWGARVLMFPGSNPGANAICCLGLLLVLSFALRVFFWVTRFSPQLKNPRFQILIWSGIREMKNHQVDVTSPRLSSQCLMARKAFTAPPLPRLSQVAVTLFTSSHDHHPASALTFSTIRLQLVFGTVYVHSSFRSSSILWPVRHGWPYQKSKTPANIALWVIETQTTPPW